MSLGKDPTYMLHSAPVHVVHFDYHAFILKRCRGSSAHLGHVTRVSLVWLALTCEQQKHVFP